MAFRLLKDHATALACRHVAHVELSLHTARDDTDALARRRNGCAGARLRGLAIADARGTRAGADLARADAHANASQPRRPFSHS
eukprot:6209162-Pleurochrysis_carterae.AAC.3